MASQKIKNRLSIKLLKTIEPLLKPYHGLYQIAQDDGKSDLIITENDPHHEFSFTILKETNDKSGHYVSYTCKPYSTDNKIMGSGNKKIEEFGKQLMNWLENIKTYSEPSILDDQIIKGYEKEFYQSFKIVEEEADFESFNYDQQVQLSGYLDTVIKSIGNLEDVSNKFLIDELKVEASTLQENIVQETKNGFMKRLIHLWAKARKGGLKLSNLMISEFIQGFMHDGAKSLLNFAMESANKIPDYILKMISKPDIPIERGTTLNAEEVDNY